MVPMKLLIYIISACVYNYFFHPLSCYPGPKLAAISELWYAKNWLSGRWAVTLLELSKTYGPVVRIAPNELLFTTLPAFEEIYGHANNKKNRVAFLKSSFYDNPDEMSPLGAERDPVHHANTRRLLAHAYSESSLTKQAPLLVKHVDGFISQIAKFGGAAEGIDVDQWFNWLTFDIIGSLAFGESFHAVDQGRLPYPMSLVYVDVINVFRRMPYLLPLAPLVMPISKLLKERTEHQEFSRDLIRKRIAKGADLDDPDFFGHLMNEKDRAKTKQPFDEFLRTNASSLLIAGSETTATTLAGITYYVLERPECLQALQKEVRNCFTDHADIDEASTRSLHYVNAVIKEALRIFIPLPINVPRVSPGAVVDGHYIPKGTIVSGHQYTLGHHPDYFTDPESFHPERWLPTDHPLYNPCYANDNLDASKPFLIGPRTCLGKNLAYLELRLILTKLVFLFDWEAVKELGAGKEVDWARDTRTQFLWSKPELRVRYTPTARH
ncbi:cytochrome P450 [Aspergillus unguis]